MCSTRSSFMSNFAGVSESTIHSQPLNLIGAAAFKIWQFICRMNEGGLVPMKRFLGVLLLSSSLLTPVVGLAEVHRYYDRDRRDYHEWNEHENRAYRHWLMEERREQRYREYRRLKAQQQREYWRWRHEHSDWR
jgi:hypothetical protein